MPDLQIRKILWDDLASLIDLYQHLHPDDSVAPESALQRAWGELLSHPGIYVFVGEAAGRLVTSCTLVTVPNLTRGARPYAVVENVVTDAGSRRRGFGAAVLRIALDEAPRMGCYKVMLLTGSAREET